MLQSSNGNTRQSLADWLFFPKNGGAALADVGPPDLSAFTVNGQQPYAFSSIMWGQAGYLFSKDYLGTLSSTFQGELVGVDFLSGSDNNARLIAASVEHHLGATFPKAGIVLSTPTTNTREVLASALAWDSAWRIANGTAADLEKVDGLWEALDRTESDLRQRRVPMVKWQGRFAKYDRATFKAVKIPLGNGATTLTVIMPTKDGFSAIESHLSDVLGEFDSGSSMQEIEFMLPVFSVTTHSDIAAPMGGSRTYAKNCTKTGHCVDDATRIASTAEDYSGVNGAGYLYRDKFDVTTTIDVSERGLASKALAAVALKATEDEPRDLLFSEGYGSSFGAGVTITQQFFPDRPPCTLTYEAEGPTQARPFIFITRDATTGAILNSGRIDSLDGKKAGKTVCLKERIEYPDRIWPLLTDVPADISSTHATLTDFVANASAPTHSSAEKTSAAAFLQSIALKDFSHSRGQGNAVVSPLDSSQIARRLIAGLPAEMQIEYLDNLAPPALTGTAITVERYSPFDTNYDDVAVWGQSGYLFRKDYLNSLALGQNPTWLEHDFQGAPNSLSEPNVWLNNHGQNFVSKLNTDVRTRLAIGSTSGFSSPWTATTKDGIFESLARVQTQMPLIQISGDLPNAETDVYRAAQISLPGRSNSLLIIVPKTKKFGQVDEHFQETLNEIDANLHTGAVTLSLPRTHLVTTTSTPVPADSNVNYSGINGMRPLVLTSTTETSEITIDQSGLAIKSAAFALLGAPADNSSSFGFLTAEIARMWDSGIDVGSVGWYPYWGLVQCDSPNRAGPADALPFIFAVRDNTTKAVLYAGRVIDAADPEGRGTVVADGQCPTSNVL